MSAAGAKLLRMSPVQPPRDAVAIGVIGLGRIGLQHAINAAGRGHSCRLAQVCDTDAGSSEQAGGRLGVSWTDAPEELIANPDVEAIVIATPVTTHAALVDASLRAGKHVLCEKPLAPEPEAVRRLVCAARSSDRRLQVGLQMRFDPELVEVHRRLASGRLGDLLLLRTVLRDREPPAREYLAHSAGFLVDAAIHTLDLARWLGGEIVEITAVGAAPSGGGPVDVDQFVVVVRFAGGGLGVLDHSRRAGYGFDSRTEVVGTRATVRVERARRTQLSWLDPVGVTTDHLEDFLQRFSVAYAAELEHFGQAILSGAPVTADGDDALAAALLCAAAEQSLREQRTIVLERRQDGAP